MMSKDLYAYACSITGLVFVTLHVLCFCCFTWEMNEGKKCSH